MSDLPRRTFLYTAAMMAAGVPADGTLSSEKNGSKGATTKPAKKLIVLGFDGVSPVLCERWMSEIDPDTGKPFLSNLARLRDQGSFSLLRTSMPAQTPVAWSCAACSANPGVTSIADFVGRNPDTMEPYLTLLDVEERAIGPSRTERLIGVVAAGGVSFPLWWWITKKIVKGKEVETKGPLSAKWPRRLAIALLPVFGIAAFIAHVLDKWIPYSLPFPKTRRRGRTLWDVTSKAGLNTVVLKFPLTFPVAEWPELCMLAGVGVPDLNGTAYSWTCFEPAATKRKRTETYGIIRPWLQEDSHWIGTIPGPRSPLVGNERTHVEVRFTLPDKLVIGDAVEQGLIVNKWSQPFQISIGFSPLATLRAQVRACLLGFEHGQPRVLIGPLQFDPSHLPPNATLCNPKGYTKELAQAVGIFPTLGWAIGTHPAKDGYLEDEPFLDDCLYHFDREWEVFRHELARDDWAMLNAVFMATDRAQHIFWRHLDPEHPLHDPAKSGKGVRRLRQVFMRMDKIVGETMNRAKEIGAEVLVLSDHGFAAFNHQVHLNTALAKAGLLKLIEPSLPADARQALSGENLNRIDFRVTQAYALGLGGVYLNLKGRERDGVVSEEERELVTGIVISTLSEIRDPKGLKAVRRVVRNEDVYSGPHVNELPDLLVCFEPGYRVSWATVVGGAPDGDSVVPNRSPWSGDHCSVDPDAIPGILFCSRKLRDDACMPGLLDYAPSILGLMGLEHLTEKEWEGKNVFV